MDKHAADEIHEVIKVDCTTTGSYADRDGRSCIIGGMGVAKSIPLPPREGNGAFIDTRCISTVAEFADALLEAYPSVTMHELVELQSTNDRLPDLDERREILHEQVDYFTR